MCARVHKSLTGDLTKPLSDAGLMQQFTLVRNSIVNNNNNSSSRSSHPSNGSTREEVEMPLARAVSLNVGNDGIIGRRVSMRRRGGGVAGGWDRGVQFHAGGSCCLGLFLGVSYSGCWL